MQCAMLDRRLLTGLFVLSFSAGMLQAASAAEAPGVRNFHQVDANIYRGGQPTDQGFASLAKLGIKTDIDLRGQGFEAAAAERAGLRYIHMPWSGFKAPSDQEVAEILAIMNDSSDWPVFVHCKRGADRTGTAIACYRVSHDHWSNQQALAEAKKFGMSGMEIAMRHYIVSFSAPRLAKAATVIPATLLAPAPAPAQP